MVWIVVVVYLLTSRLIALQRLVNLKVHSYNAGYKDIKVVTGGRALTCLPRGFCLGEKRGQDLSYD